MDEAELLPIKPEFTRGTMNGMQRQPNRSVSSGCGGSGLSLETTRFDQLRELLVVDICPKLGVHARVHHPRVHTIDVHSGSMRPVGNSLRQEARVGVEQDFGERVGVAIASGFGLVAGLAHLEILLGELVQAVVGEFQRVQLFSQFLVAHSLHVKVSSRVRFDNL